MSVKIENSTLLWKYDAVLKKDKTPYKVFTPFYKNGCLLAKDPEKPINKVEFDDYVYDKESLKVDDLELLPKIRWDLKLKKHWKIGEEFAIKKLNDFLNKKVNKYKDNRNYPSINGTSQLSPYLHFG